MKNFAFLLLIAAVTNYAQMSASSTSKADAEKIASALGAGPKFVTQNARFGQEQSRDLGRLWADVKLVTHLSRPSPGVLSKEVVKRAYAESHQPVHHDGSAGVLW
jgi:hypothetical protein